MKNIIWGTLWLLAFLALPMRGGDFRLNDLTNPQTLTVGENYAYITQGEEVLIYSLKDWTLVRRLGKEGEGPWEFRKAPPWFPSISVQLAPGTLVVNAIGKIAFFSRAGERIREEKVSVGNGLAPITALGKRWVRTALTRPEGEKSVFIVSTLMDENMKKIRELGRFPHLSTPGRTNPIVNARLVELLRRFSDGNHFFLPDPQTGSFRVFNEKGECTAQIAPEYKAVPVTREDEKRWEEFFLHDPRFKMIYEADRANIEYPDYLPVVRDHRPADGKLYIISAEKTAAGYRTLVYDYSGRFRGEFVLALADRDMLESQPFAIRRHTLFQLVEDAEEEEWFVRITPLPPLHG